jgi:hypothetical protein
MTAHPILFSAPLMALTALLILTACGNPMEPEEIVRRYKICKDGGIEATYRTDGYTGEILNVQCMDMDQQIYNLKRTKKAGDVK